MHLSKLLIFTAAFTSGALSKCTYEGSECEWFGSAPFCGSTDANIGDKDNEGRTLEDWTKEVNIHNLCDPGWGTLYGNCCDDYGSGCWSGYKRLWCRE